MTALVLAIGLALHTVITVAWLYRLVRLEDRVERLRGLGRAHIDDVQSVLGECCERVRQLEAQLQRDRSRL